MFIKHYKNNRYNKSQDQLILNRNKSKKLKGGVIHIRGTPQGKI